MAPSSLPTAWLGAPPPVLPLPEAARWDTAPCRRQDKAS